VPEVVVSGGGVVDGAVLVEVVPRVGLGVVLLRVGALVVLVGVVLGVVGVVVG
jgi:hypothetical protein